MAESVRNFSEGRRPGRGAVLLILSWLVGMVALNLGVALEPQIPAALLFLAACALWFRGREASPHNRTHQIYASLVIGTWVLCLVLWVALRFSEAREWTAWADLGMVAAVIVASRYHRVRRRAMVASPVSTIPAETDEPKAA